MRSSLPARRIGLPANLETARVALDDGALTTIHVATYDAASTVVRVVRLRRAEALAAWCARSGVQEAVVGGFFLRPEGRPLGELRTRGIVRRTVPFAAPWRDVRSCVNSSGGRLVIARRDELPAFPRGDLLQAGPLLVRDGAVVVRDGEDDEGFSAGAHQFDSDIAVGRYPRAALATTRDGRILALAADGRSADDAGLTLPELARVLVDREAEHALNLDGGGSTSLVCGGVLRNVPRGDWETPLPGGRPISTALVFQLR
jgi:Phosphodiester glycosidase